MSNDYWQKQGIDSPLYPDILWARPESRRTAGKLLVAGGNLHGFANVGAAYMAADRAGVGVTRALLPDALQKTVGHLLEQVVFAPSTPSGSFAKDGLGLFLEESAWADGVLLAGDFGRNSETAVLLEGFVTKYSGLLTLTGDSLDYFLEAPDFLANRTNTLLVVDFGRLQHFASGLHFETPFISTMGLLLLTQALHELTQKYPVIIVTKELDNLVVAYNGNVSSTKLVQVNNDWETEAAAKAGVFWLQNPNRPFEAVSTSVFTEV